MSAPLSVPSRMASKMAGMSKLKLEDSSSGEEYIGTAKPAEKKTTKPRKKPQYEDDLSSSEDEVKTTGIYLKTYSRIMPNRWIGLQANVRLV